MKNTAIGAGGAVLSGVAGITTAGVLAEGNVAGHMAVNRHITDLSDKSDNIKRGIEELKERAKDGPIYTENELKELKKKGKKTFHELQKEQEKLISEFEEAAKKDVKQIAKTAKKDYIKKNLPKRMLKNAAKTGVGVGTVMAGLYGLQKLGNKKGRKYLEEKQAKKQKESSKNFSEKSKNEQKKRVRKHLAIEGGSALAGIGAGYGLGKVIDKAGGKIAGGIVSRREDRKLANELKKVDRAANVQRKWVKENIKDKSVANTAIRDINKRAINSKTLRRVLAKPRKEAAVLGAKLSFPDSKLARNIKIGAIATGAVAGLAAPIALHNKNKKK